jgi:hypothetical protein
MRYLEHPMTLQGTYHKDFLEYYALSNVTSRYHKESLEYSAMSIYKVPQEIPRVLDHVYIRYHKESLEYSAMSI